jgi:predicted aminopeptidase
MRIALMIGGLIAGGVLVSACASLPYYMQAISGQVGLLRQRVPIEEVIVDPAYDQTTRAQLEVVLDLRRFAVDEFALPDNGSYTTFVDLGRDFVVWNVVAANEFSVLPETWCFPVAGCVSYRGYFDRSRAERFAAKLKERGLDTFTGGSRAYSTLGHFSDPVLNTMLNGGDVDVAATLFHELAHQRLYVKDDTELSESFATAVEQLAVESWLERSNRAEALDRYRSRLARQRDFADLVARQRDRLAAVFESGDDAAGMRRAKAEAFEIMRDDYEALKSDWGGNADYDGWFASELNNASLVAVTSYQRWVTGLRSRLEALGPEAFYVEMEALVERDPPERTATLESWNSSSAMAALADNR